MGRWWVLLDESSDSGDGWFIMTTLKQAARWLTPGAPRTTYTAWPLEALL